MTEWIVTSSVLILVMVALRYLLRGKISLRLQYGLWALVLMRLLVPFSFVQSPISVMNAVEKIDTVELSVTADEIGSDFSDIEYVPSTGVINGYYAGDYDRDFPTVIAPEATEQQFNQLEKAIEAKDVLVPIWLAGVGVMLAVFLISNLRFGGVLRRDRRWLDVPGSIVPVYISAKVETPCLFGFFRPAIYVTEDCAGDESVLRHVLAHESTHYRHGDNIWAVLRCLSLALHWYNPLVWLAAFLSRRDAELACDEGAIKCLGEDERMNYGRTLIGLTCQDVAAKGLVLTATTMTGSKKSIRERIMLIAKKPKMALYTLVAVLLVAAVAVGCTFSGAESGFTDRDAKKEAKSLAAGCAHSNYLQIMDNPEILRYKGEDDKDKYIRVSYPLKNDERHIVVFLNMCDANGNYLDEPYSAEVILSNSGLPIIGDPELVSSVSMWADGRANPEIPPEHEAELLDYLAQLEYGELWPPQIAEQMPSDTHGFTVYYADGSSMNFGLDSISLPGDIYYQIQRPGEPDWLSDIIMGVSAAPYDPSASEDTPLAAVTSHGSSVAPYEHLVFSKEWTEKGWLSADGLALTPEYIQSIADKIPEVHMNYDFSITINTGLRSSLTVYDENFQPVHSEDDYYYGFTAVNWLRPGEYYCVFGVYGPEGEYIESEGEYEESAYQCVFRLIVDGAGYVAKAFSPYDCNGFDFATYSANGKYFTISAPDAMDTLEAILSRATETFLPACPFGSTINIHRSGGDSITICPAEDSCSVFFSDGKCWELSNADMAAMMEIFNTSGISTPASSSHYYAHIARFEAVAQNHVQALLSDMIGAEDEYMGKIINTKVYMLNFLYLSLKEDTIACELHYAFEYENPDPMLLGYAAEGSGEYEGMWITSYKFKLELQPDGTWEQYTYDGWEPFHSEFEWGYVPVYSAEFIGEELTYALQNNKPDLLMRILPLIDFSAITAEQLEPLYELVQKAAVGTDQLYRDLYVMRAAPNTDGAYTDLMASTLYRQYLADSVAFDEALSYLSTDEQNFIMELLEDAKG